MSARVEIRDLSKSYLLGTGKSQYVTLRDELAAFLRFHGVLLSGGSLCLHGYWLTPRCPTARCGARHGARVPLARAPMGQGHAKRLHFVK